MPLDLGVSQPLNLQDIDFESACLKAPIHFAVDWILLHDATRTLMKATVHIRRTGLRHRMPQEPLEFLREINPFCVKMVARHRTKNARKHRKDKILSLYDAELADRLENESAMREGLKRPAGIETRVSLLWVLARSEEMRQK